MLRAVLLLACLAAFTGLAPAAERVALQLSWRHQFQFAGYYVAQAKGYYREAGLVVDLRGGGPGAVSSLDAVAGGQAQFGIANSGLAVARMNGQPVQALAALLQRPASIWLTPDDTPSPPDLAQLARGRVMWAGPIEDSIELLLPLVHAGVDLRSLHSVPRLAFGDAIEQRAVELAAGYSTNERQRLLRAGVPFQVVEAGHPLDGVPFYGEVLFTNDEFARRHPQLVERFREASLKGWADAFADIEGTARLIRSLHGERLRLDDLVEEGRRLRELAQPERVELGQMSRTRWGDIARTQHALGFGEDPGRVDDLIFRAPAVAPVWPDPVRLGLLGLVVALLYTAYRLWHANRSLVVALRGARQDQDRATGNELRFHFLLDAAPFPVLMYALDDGAIVYANDRAQDWLGLRDGEAGDPVHAHMPALGPGTPLMQRLQASRILRNLELEVTGRAGAPPRWCLLTVRAIEHEGRPCAYAAMIDITMRKEAELELSLLNAQRGRIIEEVEVLQAKLRDVSLRDPLTGLFNRRYLDATLKREMSRCLREGRPLSVLVIDADHFKRINDTHGHSAGDDVLRAIAALLQSTLRAEDVICRYGGEEFVAVMPGSDLRHAALRGENLRQQIEAASIATDGGFVRVTVSVGAALARPDDGPTSVFNRADEAVYQAKQTGRNRVVCADECGPADPLRAGPTAAAEG